MQSNAVYPNGKLGGPIAVLYIDVVNVLTIDSDHHYNYTHLDSQTIISLADEVALEYEGSLGLDFTRLAAISPYPYLFIYPYYYGGFFGPQSYTVVYIALLGSQTPISSFQNRISGLGGFMNIADTSMATSWPSENKFVTEIYTPAAIPTDYYYLPFNVYFLFGLAGSPVMRTLPGVTGYEWEFQSSVLGEAGFHVPGYLENSAGMESYSFKQHVGFPNNIRNKMLEESSCESISIFGGAAPNHITLQGAPLNWEILDEDYTLPFYPVDQKASDMAEEFLAYYPRMFAMSYNNAFQYWSPNMFDYAIDTLWSTPIPPVDYSTLVRDFNWSEVPSSGCVDMNYDLLTLLMTESGMTPETLIALIDMELAEQDPGWALVKAFINYFDNYNLLDFLDNDVYADPVKVGEYIDQVILSVAQILKEQGGIDFPTEFQTKEALATFVEEHWDITLQALWDALASFEAEPTAIKTAVQDMLEGNNLQEHLIPYMMADFSRPISAGMGFVAVINMNFTAMTTPSPYDPFDAWAIETIDTSDVVLGFEVSLDSIEGDAPYLHVTKTTPNRVVDPGAELPFTITVKNYGSRTAYDVKILDGSSSGLDGVREFYWTKEALAPSEQWTIEYTITASDSGLYTDVPVLCAYFNTTIDSFTNNDALNWEGSVFYTMSSLGYTIQIGSELPFNFGMNLSTIVTIGSIGVIAVVVVLWIRSRK
jgi:uncharacterized repeat protein (TIGR01451 family)